MSLSIDSARGAFARRAWREACDGFSAAAKASQLPADDFERLAVAAYLVGENDVCTRAWENAHRSALETGDGAAAARCAALLSFCLLLQGQMARAGGWLARAERVLDDAGLDCAASGYVLIPRLLGVLDTDPSLAADLAVRAAELGKRFGDADLRALGVLSHGQALIAMGEVARGVGLLDEVMVSVTSGEVGPVMTGVVYCAVIIECLQLCDIGRASEWTAALGDWCDVQPDLVPYRGQCLVHRSQLQQFAGRWSDAIATAGAACHYLADPPHPAIGLAYYQQAELHRLRGDFDRAEADYRKANRHGHDPIPGIALLELARGDVTSARVTIGRALQEHRKPPERPALLAAAVEICRAAGDLDGARTAADELVGVAAGASSTLLQAMAAHTLGTVLAGEGDVVAALAELRAAAAAWRSLGMPYEAARTAVAVGLACAAMGDGVAAALELANARDALVELGARPEIERLDALMSVEARGSGASADRGASLSAREREVLVELAAGKTNREIAETLVISQHTVGRHVESIFAKLGVTSRAAATAYAYEHHLLSTR
jgi:DNA-binding CsgD family transcriptional regulator/tetratricopeptide (TPR) repeat protein